MPRPRSLTLDEAHSLVFDETSDQDQSDLEDENFEVESDREYNLEEEFEDDYVEEERVITMHLADEAASVHALDQSMLRSRRSRTSFSLSATPTQTTVYEFDVPRFTTRSPPPGSNPISVHEPGLSSSSLSVEQTESTENMPPPSTPLITRRYLHTGRQPKRIPSKQIQHHGNSRVNRRVFRRIDNDANPDSPPSLTTTPDPVAPSAPVPDHTSGIEMASLTPSPSLSDVSESSTRPDTVTPPSTPAPVHTSRPHVTVATPVQQQVPNGLAGSRSPATPQLQRGRVRQYSDMSPNEKRSFKRAKGPVRGPGVPIKVLSKEFVFGKNNNTKWHASPPARVDPIIDAGTIPGKLIISSCVEYNNYLDCVPYQFCYH